MYNLRDLLRPTCPECGEPLVLTVGATRPVFGRFVVALAPEFFAGMCALFMTGELYLFRSSYPTWLWWYVLFGYVSGGCGVALWRRRFTFLRMSSRAQSKFALMLWGIHVALFIVLALSY